MLTKKILDFVLTQHIVNFKSMKTLDIEPNFKNRTFLEIIHVRNTLNTINTHILLK